MLSASTTDLATSLLKKKNLKELMCSHISGTVTTKSRLVVKWQKLAILLNQPCLLALPPIMMVPGPSNQFFQEYFAVQLVVLALYLGTPDTWSSLGQMFTEKLCKLQWGSLA